MKATLVFPGITACGFNSFGKENVCDEANLMPHGLALISANAKAHGHEIDLLDLRMLRGWEHFDEEVRRRGPTVYGVTSMSVDYGVAAQCVERIKRVERRSVVVIGGVHATVDTERVAKDPHIDHIVTGEGEVTFSGLLTRLERRDATIPRILKGEEPDVERIPWADRELFDYRRGELMHPWLPHLPAPFITMLIGRSCPFRCNFCQPAEKNTFGGKARIRSAEHVMAELRFLREQYDFKSIMIHDDLFIIDRQRVEAFCHAYRENGFDQPFVCQVRADIICKNEALVALLAETGLSCMMVGFESGNQRVLDFLDKGTTVEQNLKAAEICRKHGIRVFANYMLGLPTETPREAMDTVRMVNVMRPDYPSPSFFTPHPGSGLYEYCDTHDLSLVRSHESFRRNPTEAKIKGMDYQFLHYAVQRSQEYRVDGRPEPLNAAYFDLQQALDVVGKDDQASRRKAQFRALDYYYNNRYLRDNRTYEEMSDDATVAVEACDRYDYREVYRQVKACLAHLGGMGAFVRPGQTALLKVNLVGAHAPESAAVTHPNVVAAVARLVVEAGGRPVIADWPGRPDEPVDYGLALERSGLRRVADASGFEVWDLNGRGTVDLYNPDGAAWKRVPATRALYEADVLISLAKLKTHDLAGFTGAVKNVWGLLGGGARRHLHQTYRDPRQFAEALVDAYAAIRPNLSLTDGIVAMEGDGPERGTPRKTGFLAASRSGPALDYTSAALAGIEPMNIPTLAACVRRGLVVEDEIFTKGSDLEPLLQKDFRMAPAFLAGTPERADVLVTGGTGFIGRALVARLVQEGHRVVVPTRRDVPPPSADAPVDYLRADVSDPLWTELNAFALSGVKRVFHLAASLDYFGDEAALQRTNVEATRHLLGWALQRRVERFVLASSIEAAGTSEADALPIPEDRPPAPVSAYGQSKAEAEAYVQAAVERGLSASAMRVGQVYGEGGMSFVLEVVKALINGGDLMRYLPVYADQILHPVHIGDVVAGLIAASKGAGTGVYHLCGPEPTTVGAIFEIAALALGLPLPPAYAGVGERTAADVEAVVRHEAACRARKGADLVAYLMAGGLHTGHRAYAVERAAQAFGFRASVGIEEGIVRTIRWLKESQSQAA